MFPARALLILTSAVALAQPVWAQEAEPEDATDRKVQVMITQERAQYGPPPPAKACGAPGPNGEIVVCGRNDGAQWRVPPTSTADPTSREALNDGLPRAPNVSGLPDCSRGCIGFGSAPPPAYIIDYSKIPDAPPGSDADLIAKGEKAEN